MRRAVLFDSSFLIALAEKPTPWQADLLERAGSYEPLLLDRVREELDGIAGGSGRRATLAAVAKGISDGFTVVEARSKSGRVDDEIISYAKENEAAVATMDKDLMQRLDALGLLVITLRRGRVHASRPTYRRVG